jgi:hypothetical protein
VELCDQANYSHHPEAVTGDVQLTTLNCTLYFPKAGRQRKGKGLRAFAQPRLIAMLGVFTPVATD